MTAPKHLAVEYDPHSWEVDYKAGLDGKAATAPIPKDVTDELAYYSAMIEGHADRSKPPEKRCPQTRPQAPVPGA